MDYSNNYYGIGLELSSLNSYCRYREPGQFGQTRIQQFAENCKSHMNYHFSRGAGIKENIFQKAKTKNIPSIVIFWILFQFFKSLKIMDKINSGHGSFPEHQEQTSPSSKLKTYSLHIFQHFSEWKAIWENAIFEIFVHSYL